MKYDWSSWVSLSFCLAITSFAKGDLFHWSLGASSPPMWKKAFGKIGQSSAKMSSMNAKVSSFGAKV